MNKTKYEKCKIITMNKTMKEFEKGKLKDRSKEKIKSRKQAVAIGLSISEKKCKDKFSEEDYRKIEELFYKNIYDKDNKVSKKNLNYSTYNNAYKLINYYRTNKKYKKANNIFKTLIIKILHDIRGQREVNWLIINDLYNNLVYNHL